MNLSILSKRFRASHPQEAKYVGKKKKKEKVKKDRSCG